MIFHPYIENVWFQMLTWFLPLLKKMVNTSGIILWKRQANEKWCYIVTSSLIGWAHTQNDPWYSFLLIFKVFMNKSLPIFLSFFINVGLVFSPCNLSSIWPGPGSINELWGVTLPTQSRSVTIYLQYLPVLNQYDNGPHDSKQCFHDIVTTAFKLSA